MKNKTSNNKEAESQKGNKSIIDKTMYSNLLDALDILHIESILDNVEKIKNPKISGTKTLVYTASTNWFTELPDYIKRYHNISENISLLSERAGSIKSYFTDFPWDVLEKAGKFLDFTFRNDLSSNHEVYNSYFIQDLEELKIRLQQIIKITEQKNPEIKQILSPGASLSLKEMILKEKCKEQKPLSTKANITNLSNEQDKKEPGLKFQQENAKPSGLANIRKITEPVLDKEKQEEILKLIPAAGICNPLDYQGKTALLGITIMIGEIGKNVSEQTKDKNKDLGLHILKEFRDKIHKFLDYTPNAKHLFAYLNTVDSNAIFVDLQKFLTTILKSKIESLNISLSSIEDSKPFNLSNPLPAINQSSLTLDKDKIDRVLKIIIQALPKYCRSDKEIQIKLDICKDFLSGDLPLPLPLTIPSKDYPLQNLFYLIFKEQLADFKDLYGALNKNHDSRAERSSKREKPKIDLAKQDIDFLNKLETDKNYLYIESERAPKTDSKIKCLEEIEEAITITSKVPVAATIKQKKEKIINDDKNETSKKEIKYIKDQVELLTRTLETIHISTDNIIKSANGDYQSIRQACENKQFHYSHLFHLIVIGQCIQNIIGKENFLKHASAELLIEFEFLKWARNGLMHNKTISEVGSVFKYFNNDLLNLQIKESGARAYDTDFYLKHLKPKIDTTIKNIETLSLPLAEESINSYYQSLLLKQLENAYIRNDSTAEKLILKMLGEAPQSTEWYAPHAQAMKLLNKSMLLDLAQFYHNKQKIIEIAKIHLITIKGFFGNIINYGTSRLEDNSGILVECNGSDIDLAFFKKELTQILNHRLLIITEKHLSEYPNSKELCGDEAKDNQSFESIIRENSFDRTMKAIALHLAIEANSKVEEIEKLELKNCNLNLIYKGYTPLQRAYSGYTKNEQTLKLLINLGADVNIKDKHGDTLAHYAVEEDNVELLKLLQVHGANFNIEGQGHLTPFDLTGYFPVGQCSNAYKFFLSLSDKISLEKRILQAVKNQDIVNLKKYLKLEKAEECLNKEIDDELIFNTACGVGNLEIIHLLFAAGCHANLSNSEGKTALHDACYADNIKDNETAQRIEVLRYLIEERALDVNALSEHEDTPLSESIWSRNATIVKYLLDKGASPNLGGFNSPLLTLINSKNVDEGHLSIIKLLLDCDADLFITDKHVGNCLHLACERGHLNVVQLLLSHAKKTALLDELLKPTPNECWVCKGMTPYEIALKYKHSEITTLLTLGTLSDEVNNNQISSISLDISSILLSNNDGDNLQQIIGETVIQNNDQSSLL